MKGKHFIALSDYTRKEADLILARAAELKHGRAKGLGRRSLAGKSVALIFEKSSTRTRVSFEVGVAELGGYPLFLSGKDLQISRGEPIKDTARVLSRYVHAIVLRARRHEDVLELAKWSTVPVINGLTDLLHPCQILADLFTLKSAGLSLDRMIAAYVGDGNNVANSWIEAAGIYHFELRVACPKGYEPDSRVLKAAVKRGARVGIFHKPEKAAAGADVLYTDVWVSMGQEEEKAKRQRAFAGFQINRRLLAAAGAQAKVMHCLPAHRGEEISDDAIESEHSVVFTQAENRLHVQKAVLELLAGNARPAHG